MGAALGGELAIRPFKAFPLPPDVEAAQNIRPEVQAFQHNMTSMLFLVYKEQMSFLIVLKICLIIKAKQRLLRKFQAQNYEKTSGTKPVFCGFLKCGLSFPLHG